MFILVNSFDNFGLSCSGKFDTHEKAFAFIASEVACNYDGFDLMSLYPFDDEDDCLRYKNDDIEVYAGKNWCKARNHKFNDNWLIIEV